MNRILIADDHRIIVSGLQALLRDTDFEVVGAVGDGTEVAEAIIELRPDILLLDVRMPGRTGVEVLRAMRSSGDELPVVLLTAELDDAELVEAVRLGVNGIVLKEGAHSLLLPCLEAVRSGQRWIEQGLLQRALDLTMEGDSATDPLRGLNPRERAIAALVGQGMRNREIAGELDMNEGTVKVYLYRIYKKLGLGSRTELAIRLRDR
ncbi:MAG TPA: response regulator transcription factor [Allosphingosinicella sp.]|nr:response regulator transcription factor [Allosphingosinicella sp.]